MKATSTEAKVLEAETGDIQATNEGARHGLQTGGRRVTRRRLEGAALHEAVELAKAGNAGCVARVLEACRPMVFAQARAWRGLPVGREDLVQEGFLAVWTAVETYDASRGAAFTTYAHQVIRRRMLAFVREQASGAVRVPAHASRLARAVAKSAARVAEAGRWADEGELARDLGVSVRRIRTVVPVVQTPVSLDEVVGEGLSTRLELLADPAGSTPAQNIDESERTRALHDALHALPERTRRAIALHFGLGESGEHTYAEIAQEIGVCKERARQVVELGLVELRRHLEKGDLRRTARRAA